MVSDYESKVRLKFKPLLDEDIASISQKKKKLMNIEVCWLASVGHNQPQGGAGLQIMRNPACVLKGIENSFWSEFEKRSG